MKAGKGHLYEGGIRVPLFIKWSDELKPKVDKKDELDKALEHLKYHRFLLVRLGYHIVYSMVWMFWVISSVFSMVVAFLSA
mgnify:CR=1 FL=1